MNISPFGAAVRHGGGFGRRGRVGGFEGRGMGRHSGDLERLRSQIARRFVLEMAGAVQAP